MHSNGCLQSTGLRSARQGTVASELTIAGCVPLSAKTMSAEYHDMHSTPCLTLTMELIHFAWARNRNNRHAIIATQKKLMLHIDNN
jgi:hypothetical protein